MNRSAAAAALLLVVLAPRTYAQVRLSGSVSGAFIEHRVRDAGTIEASSGPVAGVRGSATIASWIEIEAYLSGGKLKAEQLTTYDQRLTELGTRVTVTATPWLALRAGANRRSYVAPDFAGVRWTTLQLDAEARPPLLGTALHGLVQASLMPVVWVSGNRQRPNMAFGAETGLEWGRHRLTAGIRYAVERYQFRTVGGQTRAEQLSSLTLRFGLRLGNREE